MAKIKQLKEKKTDEIFYPVTVGEAVIFEDGRSVKDKIEKLSTYIETTYSNLKSLRDNNQLIPGALYRITDYMTTTAQENTRSAGHQFDIIVQAISESVLSEDARAIQHKFENEFESLLTTDLTFANKPYVDTVLVSSSSNDLIDAVVYRFYVSESDQYWVTRDLYCLVGLTTDDFSYENGKIIYEGEFFSVAEPLSDLGYSLIYSNYFHNSNLAAWKLMYCLDNDESRFAWAKNLYLSPVSHNKCISLRDDYDGVSLYVRQPQLDNENGYAWCLDDQGVDLTIKEYNEQGVEVIEQNIVIYTSSEDVYIGQNFTINGDLRTVIDFSEQGKGVIYQMIDEYGNNCPYDFKNIQFLRTQQWHNDNDDWTNTVLVGIPNSDIYYYTFSWAYNSNSTYFIEDTSVTSLQDDENEFVNARNNILMEYLNNNKIELNNIILVSSPYYDEAFYPQKNNTFKQNCYNNTFGNNTRDNVFDFRNFNWIVFNDYENNQTFGSVYSVYLDEPTFRKIIFMNPASASIRITSILDYPNT